MFDRAKRDTIILNNISQIPKITTMNLSANNQPKTVTQPPPASISGAVLIDACPRVLGPYAVWGKRCFDLVFAGLLSLVLLPVGLVVAACIYFSNRSAPVMYKQTRVGLWGKPFTMYKFRTMNQDRRGDFLGEEDYDGSERRYTHKTETDPRHTKLGKILRKTSLDELPQLLNVITGEMSLVGPRPEILSVAERYNIRSHARHMVRPGITGLWQISELRRELLHENVHIDLHYVRKVTLVEDIRILFGTVGAVLGQSGK